MSTVTVTFTDREKYLLSVKAQECGMSPEELLHRAATSLLNEEPEDFESIKKYLLDEYGDVYRRLA